MDFIERIFGISPDGGDGTTELIYIAVLLLAAALFAWRRLASSKNLRTHVRRSAP